MFGEVKPSLSNPSTLRGGRGVRMQGLAAWCTHSIHCVQVGRALSHRFFLRLQLMQTKRAVVESVMM
jgi:hypothetical protein